MVEKLKLTLRRLEWLLLLKTVVFAGLLFLTSLTKSWWLVLFGIIYSAWLYNKDFKRGQNKCFYSFSFFVIASQFFLFSVGGDLLPLSISLFFGLMLYLAIGSRFFVFEEHKIFWSIFYYLLAFIIFGILGYFFSGGLMLWGMTLVFVFFFLTAKEYLVYFMDEVKTNKRENLFLLVGAFLISQVFILVQFLDIGFLNASCLILIFLIAMLDLLISYFSGILNSETIKRNIIFFLFFNILVLGLATILF